MALCGDFDWRNLLGLRGLLYKVVGTKPARIHILIPIPDLTIFPLGRLQKITMPVKCLPTVSFSRQPHRQSANRLHLPRLNSLGATTRQAFTLLELLLVLAILVIIGGIVTVNISGANTEAKVNATKTQLNSLKNNIEMYQIRMSQLPETLEALRDGPSDAAQKAKWIAPIIDTIPTDAWENELTYGVNGNSYEIRSGGIDGQVNTDDDLIVEGS